MYSNNVKGVVKSENKLNFKTVNGNTALSKYFF